MPFWYFIFFAVLYVDHDEIDLQNRLQKVITKDQIRSGRGWPDTKRSCQKTEDGTTVYIQN